MNTELLLRKVSDNLELCLFLLENHQISLTDLTQEATRDMLDRIHTKLELLADTHFKVTYGA